MESLATLSEVKAFFGFQSSKEFKDEWVRLTENDKLEIRQGINQE